MFFRACLAKVLFLSFSPSGLPKWDRRQILQPCLLSSLIVGVILSILVSSRIKLSFIGILRSTLTNTILSFKFSWTPLSILFIDFETALSTIYGVDLMLDNVKLCQDRLLCSRDDLRHIVEQNIVCADALTYHYRFDSTAPDVTDQDLIAKENKVEVVSNIQTPPKKLKAKHTSNTEVLEDLNVEVESNIQKQPRQIKEKPKANPVVLDEYLPSLGPSGI